MKKILIGLSGSIAAYKSCELIRLFKKNNYSVQAIMTENAEKLISPLTIETLTENNVYIKTFNENRSMTHISIRENIEIFIIAPATANIIAKFACGIADDLLSTTFLSIDCPVIIAPAMNPNMWKHPATQKNIELLKSWGINFINPKEGDVICGDTGIGKLADIKDIYNEAVRIIQS